MSHVIEIAVYGKSYGSSAVSSQFTIYLLLATAMPKFALKSQLLYNKLNVEY